MHIKGNTFIVTGGASGLGEATVRELIARRANVAIFDLNEQKAEELAKALGTNAFTPGQVDVTSEEAVRKALQKTVDKFGRVAGCINCGGVATAAKIARKGDSSRTMTMDLFDFTVRVNLIGTFNVCKQTAQLMANQEDASTKEEEKGIIINTASVAYQDGQTGQVAYAASKGGVASMCLPMARDLASARIRVMTIAPGLFETNMTAGMNEHAKSKILKDAIFPARMGQPKEFALLACHIIENSMLNGEVIRLDGATRLGKL
ncbi:short-chain dehydrogenase/reductase SDR [Mycotypha africana]|uniref:short-chain dehydrogenase/reductase SDR n=1 Tax=Mycotypha africana TaxID=64632 RepID=UPI0023015624|nr:short-chain dehydrogenase/reductase SDR [Mycotypha africana]KAI8970429.1 short-chain dehydrogenase/reductase SDR [Mycotypha africana]